MVDAFIDFTAGARELKRGLSSTGHGPQSVYRAGFLIECMYFGARWACKEFVTLASVEYGRCIKSDEHLLRLARELQTTYAPYAKPGSRVVRAHLLHAAPDCNYNVRMLEKEDCRRILTMFCPRLLTDLTEDMHWCSEDPADDTSWRVLQQRLGEVWEAD